MPIGQSSDKNRKEFPMKIVNLTLHRADPEQKKAGVISLKHEYFQDLRDKLLVEKPPSPEEIEERCRGIVRIADDFCDEYGLARNVMIGGAPWLMPTLEKHLRSARFRVLYAFSKRRSVEEYDPRLGVTKKAGEFQHLGLVESPA